MLQLLHHVEVVEPAVGDRKWSVKVKDLQKDMLMTESFDAVLVCNGHYFEPTIPKIPGQNLYIGEQIHSHDYRVPEIFNGKTVVILGAGPSGRYNIAQMIYFAFRKESLNHLFRKLVFFITVQKK